jgi:hypothetical protein
MPVRHSFRNFQLGSYSQLLYEMARILKGLSQDGGRVDFSKNLHATAFNKYLPSEPPNFGRIHLAGQYL